MLSLHKLKSTQEMFPNGLTKEALGKVTVFEVILIKTGLFVFNSLLLEEHVGENKNCSLQRSLAPENFFISLQMPATCCQISYRKSLTACRLCKKRKRMN